MFIDSPGGEQGCRIFLDTTKQNGKNVPKWPQKYPMIMKYTKTTLKIRHTPTFPVPRLSQIYQN
jgi:hypothetical protein